MSSLRLPCPDCNDKASMQVFNDGSFCYACRTQSKHSSLVPRVSFLAPKSLQDWSPVIPQNSLKWLYKYYITDSLIKKFRIGWSDGFQRVVFPYYSGNEIAFSWLRDTSGLKTPKWLFNGDRENHAYWFRKESSGQSLVITEDVVSAIRCSDNYDVLALGGLNFNKAILSEIFLKYKQLIIWLDGDNAGRQAAIRFTKKWMTFRNIRNIKTKRDPKEYSDREIQEILK